MRTRKVKRNGQSLYKSSKEKKNTIASHPRTKNACLLWFDFVDQWYAAVIPNLFHFANQCFVLCVLECRWYGKGCHWRCTCHHQWFWFCFGTEGTTKVETIWFPSGVLAQDSPMEISSFYNSAVVNIAMLCSHWLKYLQKDNISIVLLCGSAPEGNQMVLTLDSVLQWNCVFPICLCVTLEGNAIIS